MRKKCFIISGGDYSPIENISDTQFVIACDKGYEYAKKASVKPDLIIGDFDSYEGKLDKRIPVQKYKPEKDDTDTMIAINYAIDHGFNEITLCCALGGRLDHTLGNIQAASYAALKGLKVIMPSSNDTLYFISNTSIELEKKENHSLSIFALTEKADGVNATGVKYPLKDAIFYNHSTLGVSNEWTDDKACISVGNGVLLVVLSKMN